MVPLPAMVVITPLVTPSSGPTPVPFKYTVVIKTGGVLLSNISMPPGRRPGMVGVKSMFRVHVPG